MEQIRIASDQGEVVVYAPPRLAMVGGGSESFRHVVRSLVNSGFYKIAVDLDGTSYIDSSGLGELVSGFTAARNLGGNLRLNRLHSEPKALLELTKLYAIFDISYQNMDSLPTIEIHDKDVSSLRAARALPLLLQLRENRIRVELGVIDDIYRIDAGGGEGNDSLLVLAAPHILSAGSRTALHEQLGEFEELINSPRTKEEDIHSFIDRNPNFLPGNECWYLHSKVLLEREDAGPSIPDFVLQPYDQELCELLEHKLPGEPVIFGIDNRRSFSGAVHAAAAQLLTYRDYFEDRVRTEDVFARYGIKAYRPRLSVVIGRTPIVDPVEYCRIAEGQTDVPILTYDDLLKRAKRFLIV